MARILIVDDSVTLAKYVGSVLTPQGHSITYANDGLEAEELLKEKPFDLVILDVVMPRKNGYQLCREMKMSAEYRNIPVILLTSKDGEADKYWGTRQGADEYLTKPVDPNVLLVAVNKYVSPVPAAAAQGGLHSPARKGLFSKLAGFFGKRTA